MSIEERYSRLRKAFIESVLSKETLTEELISFNNISGNDLKLLNNLEIQFNTQYCKMYRSYSKEHDDINNSDTIISLRIFFDKTQGCAVLQFVKNYSDNGSTYYIGAIRFSVTDTLYNKALKFLEGNRQDNFTAMSVFSDAIHKGKPYNKKVTPITNDITKQITQDNYETKILPNADAFIKFSKINDF